MGMKEFGLKVSFPEFRLRELTRKVVGKVNDDWARKTSLYWERFHCKPF